MKLKSVPKSFLQLRYLRISLELLVQVYLLMCWIIFSSWEQAYVAMRMKNNNRVVYLQYYYAKRYLERECSITIFFGSYTRNFIFWRFNILRHYGLLQFDFNHSIISDYGSQSRSKRNITTAPLLQLRYFFSRLRSFNNGNGVADH